MTQPLDFCWMEWIIYVAWSGNILQVRLTLCILISPMMRDMILNYDLLLLSKNVKSAPPTSDMLIKIYSLLANCYRLYTS